MTVKRLTPFVVAAVALFAGPAAFAADTPSFEVGGGWAFLTEPASDVNLPMGLFGTVNKNLSDSVGIVGDISWNRRKLTALGQDVTTSVTGFHAGPRISLRDNGNVVLWAQALAGFTRVSAGADVEGINVGTSKTGFSLQPGVGVDVLIGEKLALRFGADYRAVFALGIRTDEYRLTAGVMLYTGP